jgi:hypothetical protein
MIESRNSAQLQEKGEHAVTAQNTRKKTTNSISTCSRMQISPYPTRASLLLSLICIHIQMRSMLTTVSLEKKAKAPVLPPSPAESPHVQVAGVTDGKLAACSLDCSFYVLRILCVRLLLLFVSLTSIIPDRFLL